MVERQLLQIVSVVQYAIATLKYEATSDSVCNKAVLMLRSGREQGTRSLVGYSAAPDSKVVQSSWTEPRKN